MNTELLFHLRSLSRMVYFVTEEEDRFILKLKDVLKKFVPRTWVYNAAFGLQPLEGIIRDWQSRAHAQNDQCINIHDALIHIYKDDPKDEQNFYIITDPERWLGDPHVQRRVLNIVHQLHNDIRTIKILIFVGQRRYVPEKLSRYMEVVHDKGLSSEEILGIVSGACEHLNLPVPKDAPELFKGLTSYEIDASIAQSIVKTKKDPAKPKGKVNENGIGHL